MSNREWFTIHEFVKAHDESAIVNSGCFCISGAANRRGWSVKDSIKSKLLKEYGLCPFGSPRKVRWPNAAWEKLERLEEDGIRRGSATPTPSNDCLDEKDAEIARLRAALNPILDYDFGVNTTPWAALEVDGVVMEGCVRTADGCPLSAFDNLVFGTVSLIGMANAIGDSQRIMREGGSHD